MVELWVFGEKCIVYVDAGVLVFQFRFLCGKTKFETGTPYFGLKLHSPQNLYTLHILYTYVLYTSTQYTHGESCITSPECSTIPSPQKIARINVDHQCPLLLATPLPIASPGLDCSRGSIPLQAQPRNRLRRHELPASSPFSACMPYHILDD